jgi:hypothetical protein
VAPRVLGLGLQAMSAKRFVDWSFGHYLAIAPPPPVHRHSPRLATAIAG